MIGRASIARMADAPKTPKTPKTLWYVVGCLALAALAVPCIGILAAIAIPAFVNYTRRAKTAEARANIGSIRSSLEATCTNAGGVLPAALTPTLAAPGPQRQLATLDPAWDAYGLVGGDPMYYAYSIERPDGSSALVVAEGDLDGDGVRSRFEVRCTSAGGSSGCACGELSVTNELE